MDRYKSPISVTHPELAAQADGWDTSKFTAGSEKKVKWQCKYGHIWDAAINNRCKGRGCPFCSNKKILIGHNDLLTTHPEISAEAYEWDPTTTTFGSNKKFNWRCSQGHIWVAAVYSRKGSGCAVCSGKQIDVGFNDLATTNPVLAAQADGWDPQKTTAYSNKKFGWKCELGHVWISKVADRSNGNGCPFCSGCRVFVGFNDLATTNPVLAAQADGWDPTTLSAGSNKKMGWKCLHGHKWKSTIANRSGGTGCPTCATYGFDQNKDSWLYLIENDELGMFQVGISNFPKQRLAKHSKGGWEVIEVRGPMEGNLARGFETSILKSLKTRGATMAHKTDIQQFDGWTEAWTKDSLTAMSFKQLLDWVYEDDEKQLITKAL
jgi:hypothetical protein